MERSLIKIFSMWLWGFDYRSFHHKVDGDTDDSKLIVQGSNRPKDREIELISKKPWRKIKGKVNKERKKGKENIAS